MSSPHSVVWDTCCFVDFLSNNAKGDRSEEEMHGLATVAASIDRGRTVMIVPVVVYTEILQSGMGERAFNDFERYTQRSNVQVVDLNIVLARTGQQLRDSVARDGFKLDTVDSLFVATALHYNAQQLHTFDDKVLRFNGRFGLPTRIQKLTICRPGLSPGEDIPLPGLA